MTTTEPAVDEPPPKRLYVNFAGGISPASSQQLINVMSNAHGQGFQEVNLLMNTNGGSCAHGFQVYNVLKALPYKLITHNVGNVDSIGNVIFLAANERYACGVDPSSWTRVGVSQAAREAA